MKPKKPTPQRQLFGARLSELLNPEHPLYVLANQIEWREFDAVIDQCYAEELGRPGVNTRLMVGLMYLKHAFNESDESVVARWVENPYWQFFCGLGYMQHDPPVDSSMMSKWRKRVGAERLEKLLEATIRAALSMKAVQPKDLEKVNIDTTVQEKAVAFPTDSRLYHKMRIALVRRAQALNIRLRQSYRFVGKKALFKQHRYAHARQMKRAAKMTRKLKTILGQVVRDIERKAGKIKGQIADEPLRELLALAHRLLQQQRHSKHKLYSVHAPEVECIAKGKAHKRYEFGCKASVSTSNQNNWVVGVELCTGAPYDGHTLASAMTTVERTTSVNVTDAYVDKGYRGHDYKGTATVHIAGSSKKKLTRSEKRRRKRRSAVEPKIGHLKSDHRLGRCYLKGLTGDTINVILAAAGSNLRKLLKLIAPALIAWLAQRLEHALTRRESRCQRALAL